MITLKKLNWSNCFSYGPDNEIDLEDNIVTQIIGTNGMGKSSIPLIIEEALYNKNSKGIKKADIPNRYINDGYSICLSFEKDSDEYVIDIVRKSGIKVKLLKNGEDISSHTATNTYKTIQDLIGVDFKTFSQLVYQNTNASLQFLTATDTNRKKFLIDLLHLENYVALFEIFKEATKETSLQLATITGEVNMIEKWLSDNVLGDAKPQPLLDLEISTEPDEKKFRSLSEELENISEKNRKILQNNRSKEELKQININELQSQEIGEIKSYDELQSALGGIKSRLQLFKKQVEKLESTPDVCTSCGQDIPKETFESQIQEARSEIESLTKKGTDITNQIAEVKTYNREVQQKLETMERWRELYRMVDQDLPANILDKDQLEADIAELKERIVAAKKEIKRITQENEKITLENNRISIIQGQRDGFIEKLNKARTMLDEVQSLSNNLEVLKKAFSTNGLIAYKIENLVKELEELANTYLADLSDGRFSLEFVVSNDKLNVVITDDGRDIDIAALSSGELARVNTATLIAIRKLMSSISKSKINILFLDEVINVLDETGREKLVEVLLREDLNTYVVSHGWTHPLLQKLEVVKDGNVSALEK